MVQRTYPERMAKIDKLVSQAQEHLNQGEQVEAVVMGTYETHRRPGPG